MDGSSWSRIITDLIRYTEIEDGSNGFLVKPGMTMEKKSGSQGGMTRFLTPDSRKW